MGRGDDYASFDGDEDNSGAASYSESSPTSGGGLSPEVLARAGSSGGSGSARRHSRGGMAAKSGHSTSGHGRSHGRAKGFQLNAGSLREAAGSMLTVAVAGVVVCAIILYFTFVQATIPQFYGALGASMVVMFLLCFVAARLLGTE